VPLKVSGTLSKPSYGMDTRYIGKKVTEHLQNKMNEELRRMMLRDKNKSSSSTEQNTTGTSPAERILNRLGK